MKRLALVALGVGIGFIVAAGLLPQAQGANNAAIYKQFNLFSDAYEKVRENYVRPVQDNELMTGAIEGMVSNLDPHSSYMDPKAYSDFMIQINGEFSGIGIEVTMEDGLLKVITPIDDTPAAKAGIKTGDYIAAIDGVSIQGLDLNDAINKMRGPTGTKVVLSILRQGEKKPFDVTLVRASIQVDGVKWHREGDIGYIRISAFNVKTNEGVTKAVSELKKQIGPAIKGYVLDLRNDPGGPLDQAVKVSDDFLTGGEIVSIRGRRPADTQRFDAAAGDISDGKPVIVLINGGTASAAEIVAGALQDHKRATLIGMKSFGKGSVQTLFELEGGGALRLTTARYYTPSGRSIQAEGIVPSVAVAQSAEDVATRIERTSEADLPGHLLPEDAAKKKAAQAVIRPPAGKKIDDFQLSYALDVLHGKVSMTASKSAPAK